MISIRSISCSFHDTQNIITPIQNLSLEIPSGQFLCITGRSGSGKTTLLKTIGGLVRPASGTVHVDTTSICELNNNQLAKYRRENIGFIFQDYMLEDAFSVRQNLEVVLMLSGSPRATRLDKINEVLTVVGLKDRINSLVKNLSGGEKQRISIARALLLNPSYLLADEPCGNLDYDNSQAILSLLREQCSLGKTILLVTHNPDDTKFADRVVELKDGSILRDEYT